MTIRAKIYRGEVRHIYPTPDYPDPAKAARTDPQGLIEHWMSGSHPYTPEQGRGVWTKHPETGELYLGPSNKITTGVHWSYSPQSIPERFTEGVFKNPQEGVPLPKRDVNLMRAHEAVEDWEYGGYEAARQAHYEAKERGEIDWHESFEEPAHITRARAMVQRRGEMYRDLSAEGTTGKPYKMAVVWHGTHPGREHEDPNNPTTNYEDEINFRSGTNVPIHAMRFSVPESGITTYEQKIWHPTPGIVKAGEFKGWHTSGFGVVNERGFVPWNVAQFKNVDLPVEGQRKYWRV